MNWKNIILIILVLCIIGFLVWWFWLKNYINNEPEWNIYRNEQYGFEIKYPIDWNYYLIEGDNIMFAEDGDIVFAPQNRVDDFKKMVDQFIGGKLLTFVIHYWNKDEYDYFVQPILSADDEYGDVSTKTITIDGVDGEGYISEALMDLYNFQKGDLVFDYVIPHNQGYLSFSLLNDQYVDIFEEMVDSVNLF